MGVLLASSLTTIESRRLRDVLGSFVTGVVVVTTLGRQGRPVGLTVNSFNSVSLEPPLVLWSLSLKAPSLSAFRSHDFFAINILAENQGDLCRRFSTPAEDKFADVAFDPGVTAVPILHATAAVLECQTVARHPGGDHEIYLGGVKAIQDRGYPPLVIHRGILRGLDRR